MDTVRTERLLKTIRRAAGLIEEAAQIMREYGMFYDSRALECPLDYAEKSACVLRVQQGELESQRKTAGGC